MSAWLTVVGIGDDGYVELPRSARRALWQARLIVGAPRQLALLPARLPAQRMAWPSPFDLAPVLQQRGTPVCVLASGDPMFYGVGASLAQTLPADEMRIIAAPSSVSLAAAQLGWPLQQCTVRSLLTQPLASLNLDLHAGQRVLLLTADGFAPAAIARHISALGFGASRMTVLEHLGSTTQAQRIDATAASWSIAEAARLNIVALDLIADGDTRSLPLTPGLPDEAYRHDGQLTKRDARAITLARLAPRPGELLWDVGAGCGSIGIEWMRSHRSCRAIAVEADAVRQQLIAHNRDQLGVPGLQLVTGEAPAALADLPAPDAIFIGGGVTVPGVLPTCWQALKPGGRLIANAVTLQAESTLLAWREQHGGSVTRIALAQAQALGSFDTWRPALPLMLYEVHKPLAPDNAA
ncbi:bifunctional cobalt-precorrin-7 (C(5))-methyltransferase/cobalt-precorrin-6B (C(15))-methyltransferase [Amantichitinum ursilacus]|uniref:Precorrin-6Y C(5,15)-methyltransferase [decarboxylating] n=1 Tax=Amantichitinum ursilacus TaxID=857265 RepID=A0A0N0XIA1_9NEIS|nr:bifunctional cobalt-precorrin-7 (C(5))-methyltransferase/cobalt-precorrin-6B (C(15))-methyltransferase [Amantichitinum ursilacus]KPC52499.1 Precorrin-6Y C(5,15)-methyltransferase [decarboxylating] [Amantichitinum ursilacus]